MHPENVRFTKIRQIEPDDFNNYLVNAVNSICVESEGDAGDALKLCRISLDKTYFFLVTRVSV